MKPSIEKLQKFFSLEADRNYDNKAVMGGLEKMLDTWEAEARMDELPEELIQAVRTRQILRQQIFPYPHHHFQYDGSTQH